MNFGDLPGIFRHSNLHLLYCSGSNSMGRVYFGDQAMSFSDFAELRPDMLPNPEASHQFVTLSVLTRAYLSGSPQIQVKTSGSTGVPKVMEANFAKIKQSVYTTAGYFGLSRESILLHCLPAEFTGGMMQWMRALILDCSVVIALPKERVNLELGEHAPLPDFAALTPAQAAASPTLWARLQPRSRIILGGGSVSKSLEEDLLQIPLSFYEVYGMTETYSHVAARALGDECFHPLPDIRIYGDGEGRIAIKGAITDNKELVTNDLFLPCGNGFRPAGRADWVINSGGIKLDPVAIEAKLAAYIPRHIRFILAGAQDLKYGQKLIIIAADAEGVGDITMWRTALARLDWKPAGLKPNLVYAVSRFPQTPTGKWKRADILSLALSENRIYKLA